MNGFWDFEFTGRVMPDLLSGLLVTIQATVLGYVIALALGLLIAVVRRAPFLGAIVHFLMEFIRTTPLVIQLVFVFALAPSTVSVFTIGVVVLGVHYAAYTAEVYRSGIEGVAKGQWEASKALSLPVSRTWGAIVLPQAIRKVIRHWATTSSRCSRTPPCSSPSVWSNCWRWPSRSAAPASVTWRRSPWSASCSSW